MPVTATAKYFLLFPCAAALTVNPAAIALLPCVIIVTFSQK
jgi:hypothetical protein